MSKYCSTPPGNGYSEAYLFELFAAVAMLPHLQSDAYCGVSAERSSSRSSNGERRFRGRLLLLRPARYRPDKNLARCHRRR